jgi:hypothetical protein
MEYLELSKIKKENKRLKITLSKVIIAWEKLVGGKYYTSKEIEYWLCNDMKPIIDELRQIKRS